MSDRRERERIRKAIEEEAARRARARERAPAALLRTLAELQAEVRTILAGLPSEFDAAFLPRLLAEIDRQVTRWGDRAAEAAAPALRDAWELGPRMVTEPLRIARLDVGAISIPDSLVRALEEYAADKIGGLEQAARERIERHVRLGVLGGRSPHEVMVGIGEQLDDPGPFKVVRYRAEMVMRTETGRIHSAAADVRLKSAAAKVPGLGKQWLWSGKSRQTHAAVTGQVRRVDEDFDVGGEQMPYPRAAASSAGVPTSAENVVGCGCESVPHMAGW